MAEMLHDRLPQAVWTDPVLRRLPGMKPLDEADWLRVDEAFGAQMAERDRLIAQRPGDVLAMSEGCRAAAEELLADVLTHLQGYEIGAETVLRPDGVRVPRDGPPLEVLGRLCQEDFCILEKRDAEHVMTGAVLCFPASWTLAEKFMRPLSVIHDPVETYTDDIARRVQRLFDAVKPGRGLWRMNAMGYADPTLYQPRTMADRRVSPGDVAGFVRSERQSVRRLPETGAVVFSIHTYVIARADLTAEQELGLVTHPIETAKGV